MTQITEMRIRKILSKINVFGGVDFRRTENGLEAHIKEECGLRRAWIMKNMTDAMRVRKEILHYGR